MSDASEAKSAAKVPSWVAPSEPLPQWTQPWAKLKYFTFQPAIFPRLLGQVSPNARPGDFVNVYDKNGNLAGGGFFRIDEASDAYRLINSDGDGLSGLIDRPLW